MSLNPNSINQYLILTCVKYYQLYNTFFQVKITAVFHISPKEYMLWDSLKNPTNDLLINTNIFCVEVGPRSLVDKRVDS